MTESQLEAGIIEVLVQRLEKQSLPRLLDIKDLVDRGERLSDLDITFLEEALEGTNDVKAFVDTHPEWQDLAARMAHLYNEITAKALANEQAGLPPGENLS